MSKMKDIHACLDGLNTAWTLVTISRNSLRDAIEGGHFDRAPHYSRMLRGYMRSLEEELHALERVFRTEPEPVRPTFSKKVLNGDIEEGE